MLESRRAWCDECRRNVRADREGFQHLLWLILTIALLGVPFPFWVYFAFRHNEPFTCPTCGEAVGVKTTLSQHPAMLLLVPIVAGLVALAVWLLSGV